MDLRLKNKTALVSGSSEGIGFAIAHALAKEGASVYINGRSSKSVNAAIDKLRKMGVTGDLHPAPFDLSTAEGVKSLIKAVPHVDILVNNLGIFEVKPFEEITDEDWRRFFEVNVMSGVRLSRFYFPQMIQKNWGRIIFISSESGVNIPEAMIHYGVTKTAQLALARGLAEKTVSTGVTVNSVLPGPTYTAGVEKFLGEIAASQGISAKEVEKQFIKKERPSSLIQRFARPDEVASLVAFVCSELASAINGAALRAEGGIVRSIC